MIKPVRKNAPRRSAIAVAIGIVAMGIAVAI
jgi:hypothetical protein